jgi:hypothetical protein
MALAEAMTRAHAKGEPWDPAQPWAHWPTFAERTAKVFAAQDRRDAVINREARRAAADVLVDYGVTDTVAIGGGAAPTGRCPGTDVQRGGV